MRNTVQTFSTSLLDHVRTSNELEIVLNYDPNPYEEPWEPGERQTLDRLKLAIKYKLKSVSLIYSTRKLENALRRLLVKRVESLHLSVLRYSVATVDNSKIGRYMHQKCRHENQILFDIVKVNKIIQPVFFSSGE